jgi:hypothetical protein
MKARFEFQPRVTRLENREQPGSVLLDTSLLAGALLGSGLLDGDDAPAIIRQTSSGQVSQKPDLDNGTPQVGVPTNLVVPTTVERLPMTIGDGIGSLPITRPIGSKGPDLYFHGGDLDGRNGLANEMNTLVSDARTYDDVRARKLWEQDCYSSNNLMSFTGLVSANVEVRGPGNMSEGNGLAQYYYAKEAKATQVPTGLSAYGYTDYTVLSCGHAQQFQGHYYINVQPIGFGSGRSFQSTTDGLAHGGTGGVYGVGKGSPLANDNTWFDSTYFGYTFTDTANVFGAGTWDFSGGICKTAAC